MPEGNNVTKVRAARLREIWRSKVGKHRLGLARQHVAPRISADHGTPEHAGLALIGRAALYFRKSDVW